MLEQAELHDLIRLIYASSVDESLWQVVLERLGAAMQAKAIGLMVQDAVNPHASITRAIGMDQVWARRYAEYYGPLNPYPARSAHLMIPGTVAHGDDAIGEQELLATEYYQGFLKPQGWRYNLCGTISLDGIQGAFVTPQRGMEQGPFEEHQCELLRILLPHFHTALRLHHEIAGLGVRLGQTTEALDKVPRGLLILDAMGRVRTMNRRGEWMVTLNDGLRISQRGFLGTVPVENGRLQALIQSAAGPVPEGGAMTISRPSGRGALRVQVSPLPSRPQAAVVVLVTAPELVALPDAETLQQLLDLTPAEARLTQALVQGKTLEEFAQESGVAISTVRTHVRHVFQKTGVTRQAELVGLVLTVSQGS